MIDAASALTRDHVAEHYDDLDHWYRTLWGMHVHHGFWVSGGETVEEATRNLVHRLAMALEIDRGQSICDVGCGYGGTALELAGTYGAEVTGVTVSPAQFQVAQAQRQTEPVRFLHMDFLENEFESESFDRVIAIESTEHFADKPRLFAEMHRILKPGGRLGVCAWLERTGSSPWERKRLLRPICDEGRMPGMGSEEDYRALISKSGLDVTSFSDISHHVARTWPLVVRRMLTRLTWDKEAWKFLFSGRRNIVFAKTTMRIAAAYKTGAMRYGVFVAQKP